MRNLSLNEFVGQSVTPFSIRIVDVYIILVLSEKTGIISPKIYVLGMEVPINSDKNSIFIIFWKLIFFFYNRGRSKLPVCTSLFVWISCKTIEPN